MITIDEFNNALELFANTISKQQLGLVYYKPDKDSLPTNCIENVKKFVDINGGIVKYGWTFHHRISPKFGEYLFATHHAIWMAPNGNLIDITPFHSDEKHQPLTIDGSVIFLLDDIAEPIPKPGFLIPRPLKYFPVSKNFELKQYVESLREKEAKYYKDTYGIV